MRFLRTVHKLKNGAVHKNETTVHMFEKTQRVVLSEDAELMADERMVNDVKWHNVPSFGCSVTVRLRTRNVLLWVAQSRPDRKSDFPYRFFFFAGETSCAVFPAAMAASFLLVKAVGSASRGFSGHGCFG